MAQISPEEFDKISNNRRRPHSFISTEQQSIEEIENDESSVEGELKSILAKYFARNPNSRNLVHTSFEFLKAINSNVNEAE